MAKKQIHIGSSTVNKLYVGSTEIKKVYIGTDLVYGDSSGHVVTYHIDTNNVVEQEVADGEDCIVNAPPVSVSGYTLHGWREDSTASSTVLPTKTCDQDNIHLYAVLKQTITVSYNGNGNTGGSTAASTGTRYYNNGNAANPSITLRANGFSKTNYTFGRWSMGSTSGTKYKAGASVTVSSNTTFYAFWAQTVTSYSYTGRMQSFKALVPGTYQLKVYGAQGGTAVGYAGGKGGYSVGNVSLTENQTIYIGVGGSGATFNGGGSAYSGASGSAAGGGGTHIGKTNAEISGTTKANLFIVAGGGGGGYYNGTGCQGGAGGGTSGGNVTWEGVVKTGGTQSGGYAYGKGAPSSVNYTSGGGGGLYGGNNGYGAGAGGSGYVGGVTGGSTTAGQQSGNGSATITLVTVS